MDLDSQKGGGP